MNNLIKVVIFLGLIFSHVSKAENLPDGWFQSGSNKIDYKVAIDSNHYYKGKKSAYLAGENAPSDAFGTLMQWSNVDDFKGKRIQLSAYIQTKDVDQWAGLWFRIDGKEKKPLAFDNMNSRPITGTSQWQQYLIVLDVPQKATGMAFGILLTGNGETWIDNLEFTEVDRSVPVTDMYAKKNRHLPRNLDFEQN